MRRPPLLASLMALMLLAALPQSYGADFELRDAAGRRILLKDNGTWKYIDAEDGVKEEDRKETPEAPEVQADMQLVQRVDVPGGCRFTVMLTNKLPNEIGSIVPVFSAKRANDIVYASKSAGFTALRPGNSMVRQLLFEGVRCEEIAALQVVGGDRCDIGELNRVNAAKGRCLALVRVVPSQVLTFEK
jgi:hypothetical protein